MKRFSICLILPLLISITAFSQQLDSIIDIRDGQHYKIVKIDNDWWMQENLNIGSPLGSLEFGTDNGIIEKYCYNNSSSNCDIYGGLYTWDEMMDYQPSDIGSTGTTQGICPTGWHLPTDNEWTAITDYFGGEAVAGGKLKDTGTVYWASPNTGATNESFFTALPAGVHSQSGSYSNLGYQARFWTAKSSGSVSANSRKIEYTNTLVNYTYDYQLDGLSVRCMRSADDFNYLHITDANLETVSKIDFFESKVSDSLVLINSGAGDTIEIGSITNGSQDFIPGLSSAILYPGDSLHLSISYQSPGPGIYSQDTLTIISDDPFRPVRFIYLTGYVPVVDSIIDFRDQQVIKAVKIGPHWWLQENLNTGTRIDAVTAPSDNGIIEKYCFDDNEAYCDIYGGLYTWDEMMEYHPADYNNPGSTRGICPLGWHLPTDSEWDELLTYLGDSYWAGGKLKESGYLHWDSPNTGATNETGFTALPGSRWDSINTDFYSLGTRSYFWTATEKDARYAYEWYLIHDHPGLMDHYQEKQNGLSVRCLTDTSRYSMIDVRNNRLEAIESLTLTYNYLIDTILVFNSNAGHTLTINNSFKTGGAFSLSQAGFNLAPGDSSSIVVSFEPPSAGHFHDTLCIQSDDPYNPEICIPLAGHQPEMDSIYDHRDGQVYRIVKIGDEWWMQENLNAGSRINVPADAADNQVLEKYCYDNDPLNCNVYGGLYQWDEAMDYQVTDYGDPGSTRGICPLGFHIPTQSEFARLMTLFGGTESGGKLKEKGFLHWQIPNAGATDESGFTALGGGYYSYGIAFTMMAKETCFWSSSSGGNAWTLWLQANEAAAYITGNYKKDAYPLRCLRDPGQISYLSVRDTMLQPVSELIFYDEITDTLYLFNSGAGQAVNISSISTATTAFTINRSSGILSPGDSLHLHVTFTPAQKVICRDTLFIESDDPYTPSMTIPLFGTFPPEIGFMDVNNISCYGSADGSATVRPELGMPPYTIRWFNSMLYEDSTFFNMTANTNYWVTVTDSLGWKVTDSIKLSQPDPLEIVSTCRDTLCLNSTDGYILCEVNGGTPPYNYLWSTGDTVSDLTEIGPGDYAVWVTDNNGCKDTADFTIYSLSPYEEERICIVTIDLATGRNIVVWEKTADRGIDHYNIYREEQWIGSVPFDQLSIFIDSVADPERRPYLYQITVVDTCGNVSPFSPYHKPLFLQYVSAEGGVNLEWDEYEVEGEPVDFEYYSIYRGSDSISLSAIEENIPLAVNVYKDTDPQALEEAYFYRVAGILSSPCYPTGSGTKKADAGPYSHSLSNVEDNRLQDTASLVLHHEQEQMLIYPNPFKESTTIRFNNPEKHSYILYITDLSGQACRIVHDITSDEYTLLKRDLSPGIYFVELKGLRSMRKKIIIE